MIQTLPALTARGALKMPAARADLVSEALQLDCRQGRGRVLLSLEKEAPEIASHLCGRVTLPRLFSDSPEIIPLSPYACVPHPQAARFACLQSGEPFTAILRGCTEKRAFHITFAGLRAREDYSLVFKGDLQGVSSLSEEAVENLLETDRIPALSTITESQHEFKAGVTLQKLALQHLGRLANTTIPVRVTTVDEAPDEMGRPVEIRRYLSSAEYLTLKREQHFRLGIPENRTMGDWLIDDQRRLPAQYVYLIRGANLRVSEALELIVTADRPFDTGTMLLEDRSSALTDRHGMSQEDVIRSVYVSLGESCNLNVAGMLDVPWLEGLPAHQLIQSIRNILEDTVIFIRGREGGRHDEYLSARDFIMKSFIERLTETAALAHSQGYAFSYDADSRLPGSLTARNVTLGATVVDLDTVMPIHSIQDRRVVKDFNDLVGSVAFLRAILFEERQPALFESIREAYLDCFRRFSPGREKDVERKFKKKNLSSEIISSL